uniref:actin remodeling regulator NHS-like n=1 Tax=Myxine glutinosa TaxID=7769 RepID=UPI00358F2AC4
MPFYKRVVNARGEDPGRARPALEDLRGVAHVGLSGALRQLAQLCRHALGLFAEIEAGVMLATERGAALERRLSVLRATSAALDAKGESIPASNLYVESRLMSHHRSVWGHQGNLFLPSTRPRCVQELQKQASTIRTSNTDSARQLRDLNTSPARTPSPTALPPLESCPSSPEHHPKEVLCCHISPKTLKSASGPEERERARRSRTGRRGNAPVHYVPSSLDRQTNWRDVLPLPTPQQRMHEIAGSIFSAVVPINVSGKSFERQASVRRSFAASESVARRKKRLQRRKTITGIPQELHKELTEDAEDSGITSGVGTFLAEDVWNRSITWGPRGDRARSTPIVSPCERRVRAWQRGGTQATRLCCSHGTVCAAVIGGGGEDGAPALCSPRTLWRGAWHSLPARIAHRLDTALPAENTVNNGKIGKDTHRHRERPYWHDDSVVANEPNDATTKSLLSPQDLPHSSPGESQVVTLQTVAKVATSPVSFDHESVSIQRIGLNTLSQNGSSSTMSLDSIYWTPVPDTESLTMILQRGSLRGKTAQPCTLSSKHLGQHKVLPGDIMTAPKADPQNRYNEMDLDRSISDQVDSGSMHSVDADGYCTSAYFDSGLRTRRAAGIGFEAQGVDGGRGMRRRSFSITKMKSKPPPPKRNVSLRRNFAPRSEAGPIANSANKEMLRKRDEGLEVKTTANIHPSECNGGWMQRKYFSSIDDVVSDTCTNSSEVAESDEERECQEKQMSELRRSLRLEIRRAHDISACQRCSTDYDDPWVLREDTVHSDVLMGSPKIPFPVLSRVSAPSSSSLWSSDSPRISDTCASISSSSDTTGTTVVERPTPSPPSGLRKSSSGSDTALSLTPPAAGPHKTSSPEKLNSVTSPSSGYSSQSGTPTSLIPAPFFPRTGSPAVLRVKPKVPERTSSLHNDLSIKTHRKAKCNGQHIASIEQPNVLGVPISGGEVKRRSPQHLHRGTSADDLSSLSPASDQAPETPPGHSPLGRQNRAVYTSVVHEQVEGGLGKMGMMCTKNNMDFGHLEAYISQNNGGAEHAMEPAGTTAIHKHSVDGKDKGYLLLPDLISDMKGPVTTTACITSPLLQETRQPSGLNCDNIELKEALSDIQASLKDLCIGIEPCVNGANGIPEETLCDESITSNILTKQSDLQKNDLDVLMKDKVNHVGDFHPFNDYPARAFETVNLQRPWPQKEVIVASASLSLEQTDVFGELLPSQKLINKPLLQAQKEPVLSKTNHHSADESLCLQTIVLAKLPELNQPAVAMQVPSTRPLIVNKASCASKPRCPEPVLWDKHQGSSSSRSYISDLQPSFTHQQGLVSLSTGADLPGPPVGLPDVREVSEIENSNQAAQRTGDNMLDGLTPKTSGEGSLLSPNSMSTADLFAAIYRSKLKVLGRRDSAERSPNSNKAPNELRKMTCVSNGDPSMGLSSPHNASRRTGTSQEQFKALLLRKGSRLESGSRMSATELLRFTHESSARVMDGQEVTLPPSSPVPSLRCAAWRGGGLSPRGVLGKGERWERPRPGQNGSRLDWSPRAESQNAGSPLGRSGRLGRSARFAGPRRPSMQPISEGDVETAENCDEGDTLKVTGV